MIEGFIQGNVAPYQQRIKELEETCEALTTAVANFDAEIERLKEENFALAANQCHNGYSGEYGDHRCKYQDQVGQIVPRVISELQEVDGLVIAWCSDRTRAGRPEPVPETYSAKVLLEQVRTEDRILGTSPHLVFGATHYIRVADFFAALQVPYKEAVNG